MTGPQLPSPEHATTLAADLRELRRAAGEQRVTQGRFGERAYDAAESRLREQFTRLRSRITALELENERLTTCGCGLQLSTPRCRICDNDE